MLRWTTTNSILFAEEAFSQNVCHFANYKKKSQRKIGKQRCRPSGISSLFTWLGLKWKMALSGFLGYMQCQHYTVSWYASLKYSACSKGKDANRQMSLNLVKRMGYCRLKKSLLEKHAASSLVNERWQTILIKGSFTVAAQRFSY